MIWCWEGLRAGGEGDDRAWDGWMASLTQWTWVWVNSRSWWWTGRPGMLRFMGLQRVRHNSATELNWTETNSNHLLLFQTMWINTSSTESNLSKIHISLRPSHFSYRILSYRYIYTCGKRYAISAAKDQEKTYISNQIHSMEHYLAIRRNCLLQEKEN